MKDGVVSYVLRAPENRFVEGTDCLEGFRDKEGGAMNQREVNGTIFILFKCVFSLISDGLRLILVLCVGKNTGS